MKQSVLEYKKLLEQEGLLVEFAEPEGKEGEDSPVTLVTYFSGGADQGTLFLCKGAAFKETYLKDAVNRGAVAYVSEKKYEAGKEIPALIVNDARKAQFVLGEAFYDYPAKSLHVTALTGTKGKTTTTYMIKSVLEEAGKKVGLIGTIGAMIGEEHLPSKNTTPESYELHRMFAAMVEAGCEYVVMEVSSQGLKLDRTAGILFDYGIFTMQRKGYKRVNMCDIYQKNSFSDFFLRVNYLLVSMALSRVVVSLFREAVFYIRAEYF